MADNNGLRTLPEKEYKKAVKFHVEFYSFLRMIKETETRRRCIQVHCISLEEKMEEQFTNC